MSMFYPEETVVEEQPEQVADTVFWKNVVDLHRIIGENYWTGYISKSQSLDGDIYLHRREKALKGKRAKPEDKAISVVVALADLSLAIKSINQEEAIEIIRELRRTLNL